MESQENYETTGALEALLFIYGEPIEISVLSNKLKSSPETILRLAHELKTRLDGNDSGITMIFHKDSLQLVTKKEFAPIVESLVKEDRMAEITPAMQETLAVIAYSGPITRTEIDWIRGVNSSFILQSLLIRGFIERNVAHEKDAGGAYIVSMELLKYLGVERAENLPDFAKYHELGNQIKQRQLS